jgi:hypothetical protein
MESLDYMVKDPLIWGSILIMPLAIIGLAVFWKRFKDARAAKESTPKAAE